MDKLIGKLSGKMIVKYRLTIVWMNRLLKIGHHLLSCFYLHSLVHICTYVLQNPDMIREGVSLGNFRTKIVVTFHNSNIRGPNNEITTPNYKIQPSDS